MTVRRRFTEHAELAPDRIYSLSVDHAASRQGRTLFPSTVVDPLVSPRLLISGANQRKLGDRVVVGPWKGMPIYTLTLEERATCPRSCENWGVCYGNGMQFARRHRAGVELENLLWLELKSLSSRHPNGFVVRLHVLGDFYSTQYVDVWRAALSSLSPLRVFGYTARKQHVGIGHMIDALNRDFPDRCAIRFSGAQGPMGAVTVDRVPGLPRIAEGIVCPAQTGTRGCCGECGLCWAPAARDETIVFVLHGRRVKARAA